MIDSRVVELSHVRMHFVEAHGAGPALVIVHGLTGSHASFLPFLPALAQHAHVYAVDLRGHNLTSWTQGTYQLADYAGDVAEFLQKVVARPAYIVGHSLGGLVAIWLAAQTPEWVRGVLVEDPPIYLTRFPRFQTTGFYHYFTALLEQLTQHQRRRGTLDDLIGYVGASPAGEDLTMLDIVGPEGVRDRAIQLHHLDPTTLETALQGDLYGPHEPDDLLARVRCPVHLLAADYAAGGAMEEQDILRATTLLAQSIHTYFAEVGHMIHAERPAEYLQAVTQWVTARQTQTAAGLDDSNTLRDA